MNRSHDPLDPVSKKRSISFHLNCLISSSCSVCDCSLSSQINLRSFPSLFRSIEQINQGGQIESQMNELAFFLYPAPDEVIFGYTQPVFFLLVSQKKGKRSIGSDENWHMISTFHSWSSEVKVKRCFFFGKSSPSHLPTSLQSNHRLQITLTILGNIYLPAGGLLSNFCSTLSVHPFKPLSICAGFVVDAAAAAVVLMTSITVEKWNS